MEITEVRIHLVPERSDKLCAYCTITIGNAFVIHDLKIIEGLRGIFVAMPSRKLTDHCGRCGGKNCLRARFCNECGARLSGQTTAITPDGRTRLHSDVAHPITASARAELESAVLEAYAEELERSKRPNYRPLRVLAGNGQEDADG